MTARTLTLINVLLLTILFMGLMLEAWAPTQTIGWVIIILTASVGYGIYDNRIKEYLKSKNDFHLINTGCLSLIGIGLLFKYSHSVYGAPPLFHALDKYLSSLVTAFLINWTILIILTTLIGREPDDKTFAKEIGKRLILKDSLYEKRLFIKALENNINEEIGKSREADERISKLVREIKKRKEDEI